MKDIVLALIVCVLIVTNSACSTRKHKAFGDRRKLPFDTGNNILGGDSYSGSGFGYPSSGNRYNDQSTFGNSNFGLSSGLGVAQNLANSLGGMLGSMGLGPSSSGSDRSSGSRYGSGSVQNDGRYASRSSEGRSTSGSLNSGLYGRGNNDGTYEYNQAVNRMGGVGSVANRNNYRPGSNFGSIGQQREANGASSMFNSRNQLDRNSNTGDYDLNGRSRTSFSSSSDLTSTNTNENFKNGGPNDYLGSNSNLVNTINKNTLQSSQQQGSSSGRTSSSDQTNNQGQGSGLIRGTGRDYSSSAGEQSSSSFIDSKLRSQSNQGANSRYNQNGQGGLLQGLVSNLVPTLAPNNKGGIGLGVNIGLPNVNQLMNGK